MKWSKLEKESNASAVFFLLANVVGTFSDSPIDYIAGPQTPLLAQKINQNIVYCIISVKRLLLQW